MDESEAGDPGSDDISGNGGGSSGSLISSGTRIQIEKFTIEYFPMYLK